MARVDPEMADLLAGDMNARVEALLTARRDLDDLLSALGSDVEVTHVYRLLRGVAVLASVGALRRLAASKAVGAIEPVRGVRHC